MSVEDGNVLTPEGLPLKTSRQNLDTNDPNKTIEKSKETEETFLNDLSTYSDNDVSAYVYIRVFKYKRGRQTLNLENPDTLNNITDGELKAGSAAAGALGGFLASYDTSATPRKSNKGNIVKGIAGGVAGGLAGYAASEVLTTERTRDKSEYIGTIILPLLTPINMNYDVNWSEFTSPIRGMYEQLVDTAVEALPANKRVNAAVGAGGTPSQSDQDTVNSANKVGDLAKNDYVANVTANTVGAAFNPDNELVLNGIGLRVHSFEFMLTPKNAKEKENIKKAIKHLKIGMTPSKIGATENSAIALGYPYEFSIFFMDGREKNRGKSLDIPPIPDCALVDMAVTYNPTNVKFHKDGSPVQYRITLTFREHQTLTRDDIEEGNF